MPRAPDDKTSTCATCSYFSPDAPDGGRPDGYCQWISIPAWAQRHVKVHPTMHYMHADEGLNCWLHTKRPPQADGGVKP